MVNYTILLCLIALVLAGPASSALLGDGLFVRMSRGNSCNFLRKCAQGQVCTSTLSGSCNEVQAPTTSQDAPASTAPASTGSASASSSVTVAPAELNQSCEKRTCRSGLHCTGKTGFRICTKDAVPNCGNPVWVYANGLACFLDGLTSECMHVKTTGEQCNPPNSVCVAGYSCQGSTGSKTCRKVIGKEGSCQKPWLMHKPKTICLGQGSKQACHSW